MRSRIFLRRGADIIFIDFILLIPLGLLHNFIGYHEFFHLRLLLPSLDVEDEFQVFIPKVFVLGFFFNLAYGFHRQLKFIILFLRLGILALFVRLVFLFL